MGGREKERIYIYIYMFVEMIGRYEGENKSMFSSMGSGTRFCHYECMHTCTTALIQDYAELNQSRKLIYR